MIKEWKIISGCEMMKYSVYCVSDSNGEMYFTHPEPKLLQSLIGIIVWKKKMKTNKVD